jgi:hypothetical protein
LLFSNGDWIRQKKARNKKDQERARRLKELAESNKDHEKAREFQIMEWQAKRRRHKCPLYFLLETEFWYEKLSDYGRSMGRPLFWMVVVILLFAGIYWKMSGHVEALWNSVIYSVMQMFAFLPNSRVASEKIWNSLFCTEFCTLSSEQAFSCVGIPGWFYLVVGIQNLLAFGLLFLLGLGLRFRYRI